MKTFCMVLIAATTATPAIVSAQEIAIDASAVAIRKVISGTTCVGEDVLTFGESARGSAGTFERTGRTAGAYNVGYGTILIRRDQDLHGHVTSVSPLNRVLYLSTSTYRCGIGRNAGEELSTAPTDTEQR